MTQAALVDQQPVDTLRLAATLERLSKHTQYLQITLGVPSGDGWLDADDLTASHSIERTTIMQRIALANQTQDQHVIAMWFWNAYTWPVLMGGVLSYLLEQRVPNLASSNVVLHWNEAGMTDRMALRSGNFFALPDDPAADHQDCAIVPDRSALRTALITQITQQFVPPMLRVLVDHSPLGARALWATVADRCVSSVLQATQDLGNDECRHEIAALLHNPSLHGNTGVLALEHEGRDVLFLQRGGCCYSYKLPRYGYCATCPLLPIEERVQRLQAQLTPSMDQEG